MRITLFAFVVAGLFIIATPVALAYGQVNGSFVGFVSGDQSSSGPVKEGGQQVSSPSNAPTRGDGERAKTLPTGNN